MTEQQAEAQAEQASTRVLAVLAAYEAGNLSRPDAESAMALAVFAGKLLATRLADIAVSTLALAPPIGLRPGEQHLERLEQAAQTATEEPQEAAERLRRLAVAEVLASHRKTLHAAIREQGYEFWERVVEPGACEICEPLAGEVQPISRGSKDHPGCRCSLKPHGERKQPESSAETGDPTRRITFTKQVRTIA